MKPKKPEPVYVCDTGRMREYPARSPAHWLYALLLMAAVGGALWQHGHALLTLSLLGAIPVFAALVHIPYRWVSQLARQIVNCLLFGAAVWWLSKRYNEKCADLVLVESLAIASLIFIASGKPRDYFYVFFISVFLLVYGALVPRLIHLYLFAAAAVLVLGIALAFRSHTLGGGPPVRETSPRRYRCLHHALIQLILAGICFWYAFALMPVQDNELPGLFETSFLTERENAMPPEMDKWLRPKKAAVSPDAPRIFEEPPPTEQPPTARGEKGTPVKIPEAKSKSIIDGEGSASQGQDLVFYVRSPVKLYHMARIYDEYDGAQWKVTARMKKNHIRDYRADAPVRSHYVTQKYTLLKLVSKRLYSGFRSDSFTEETENAAGETKPAGVRVPMIRTVSFASAELVRQPETMPFNYSAWVHLNIVLKKTEISVPVPEPAEPAVSRRKNGRKKPPVKRDPDPAWNETLPRGHFLRLPQKAVSKRVRQLAAEITAGIYSPYGRAIALRDHLRKNYPYKLQAQPVPPGREPADYFLFELKEGHCEYFACALAVLARCAGLPSRVVTGFSPGNFNTLTNMFEVYEYHAHAWTQIYVDKIGWLTIDATPPSALVTQLIPAGIGQLRDPFGDEWRIIPPELTDQTQEFLRKDIVEKAMKQSAENKLDNVVFAVVKKQEQIQESVNEKYGKAVNKIKKSREEGTLKKLESGWNRFCRAVRLTFSSICDFLYSAGPVVLAGLLLAAVVIHLVCMWLTRRRFRNRIRRMFRLAEEAEKLRQEQPRQSVLNVYEAFRIYLDLSGIDRNTGELLDFAGRLTEISRKLGESARVIFLLFYKAEYSSRPFTSEEADAAIRSLKEVRIGDSFQL